MTRWMLLGLLLFAPACATDDDGGDLDAADATDPDDRAGDGHWEDGDALEIRDHVSE